MQHTLVALPPQVETIAELRELYRAAEARSARMRLLFTAGQDLARADAATLDDVMQQCAERLAYFVGRSAVRFSRQPDGSAIPLPAPGNGETPAGWIVIDGLSTVDQLDDAEDRTTFAMYLEMMGATADRIARDTERMHLLATLQEREMRLESLVGQLFTAQEEERRRVSHDLHDGVAQTATALVRMLEGAGPAGGEDIRAADRAQLAAIARDLVSELRGVIGGLRPTLLDDLGLKAALQALSESLQQDGYDVRLSLDRRVGRLAPTVETALFRVAQEAVANIRKHAGGPCLVSVELGAGSTEEGGHLRICDSGQGLDPARPVSLQAPLGTHVGIAVMRERMAAIGGRLDWRAGEAGGVSVTAYLPVPQ